MSTHGSSSTKRQKRLVRLGGVVLLLLVGALVFVPILLWPAPVPRVKLSTVDRPTARPASHPTTQSPERHRPDTQPNGIKPSQPSRRPPQDPIVDQTRIQEGSSPTISDDLPTTQPTVDNEWDRSRAAKERALRQFGGTKRTEGAVDLGLQWLAAHQSPSGLWDRLHFDRRCPSDDRCLGTPTKRTDDDLRGGITGLALLAFLGAGYTDQDGPYRHEVRAAVDALLDLQSPGGGFSRTESMAGYNDALATLALAEFYAMTDDDRVREPLERAVAQIVASQQDLGGWDYGRSPHSARNDTSISAWMVQALHACAASGIDVPRQTLVRAALHFHRATERDGRVRYADAGSGFKLDDNMRPKYRHGPAMVAAGMMSMQMLGWRLESDIVRKQRALLLSDLPSAPKARGRDPTKLHNEYYWYYGTLAMFQRGGDDWSKWNNRLRDAILPLQDRTQRVDGSRRHSYGSWDPYGANWGLFGRMAGRVYTTAICVLTLEVYYRHTPAFLRDDVVFVADDWRTYLRNRPAVERLDVARCLVSMRVEVCEPVLVGLLEDADRGVALAAANGLATIDSPMGLPILEDTVPKLPPWRRAELERAIEHAKAVLALPPAEGRVRLVDAARGFATLELPRSYAGMTLRVVRDNQTIATIRVVQRFTGRPITVARWDPAQAIAIPITGDRVVE